MCVCVCVLKKYPLVGSESNRGGSGRKRRSKGQAQEDPRRARASAGPALNDITKRKRHLRTGFFSNWCTAQFGPVTVFIKGTSINHDVKRSNDQIVFESSSTVCHSFFLPLGVPSLCIQTRRVFPRLRFSSTLPTSPPRPFSRLSSCASNSSGPGIRLLVFFFFHLYGYGGFRPQGSACPFIRNSIFSPFFFFFFFCFLSPDRIAVPACINRLGAPFGLLYLSGFLQTRSPLDLPSTRDTKTTPRPLTTPPGVREKNKK